MDFCGRRKARQKRNSRKENIGLKGTLKDMQNKLKDCYRAFISIEDYKQETANQKLINKLERKIKEHKRYYNV